MEEGWTIDGVSSTAYRPSSSQQDQEKPATPDAPYALYGWKTSEYEEIAMTVVAPTPTTSSRSEPSPHVSSSQLFNRPPRVLRLPPTDEVEIPGPPQRPPPQMSPQIIAMLIPLVASLVYFVFAFMRGSSGGNNIWFAIPIVLISLMSVGAAYYNYRKQKQAHEAAERAYHESYQQALERTRRRLQALELRQRECYEANDPDLSALLQIVRGTVAADGLRYPAERLWERRPTDYDFLCLRIGRGNRPTSLTIKPPSVNAYSQDVEEPLAMVAQFQQVRNVPLSVSLRTIAAMGIAGPSGRTLDALRALLWQIVVHHAPSEVRIAAFWDSAFDNEWEWLRWLPHTRAIDGERSYRLLARYDRNPHDLRQVMQALLKELKRRDADGQRPADDAAPPRGRPYLVVVLSDYQTATQHDPELAQFFAQIVAARPLDVGVICTVPAVRDVPSDCGGYLDLSKNAVEYVTMGISGPSGGFTSYTCDTADHLESDQLAAAFAPIEEANTDGSREMPRNVPLLPLLSITNAQTYAPATFWEEPPLDSWHPVPVGQLSADTPLEIDLNEGRHGVHGMIAGATGAGKSELLLSFLMALAIKHNPDRLNFMLIDFKGGATFRDMEHLPHTAGFVTDLSGFLAERALIAMNSELDRRKILFNSKNVPNIKGYRRAGHERDKPIPNLLIVIDEFDEMIRDYPDFQMELIRVAKQGRSLGVHLLFATQQPSLIKEGLRNNLSYWMSLRVNSRDDSKEMVGIPDAALLGTDTPGRGFFRDKNSGVRMFQSAMITAPYKPSGSGSSREVDVTGRIVVTTDEGRARRVIRSSIYQLLDSIKGVVTEIRRREALDQIVQDIREQCNDALDRRQLSRDEHEQQSLLVSQILREFLQELANLTFDPAKTTEAQAIESCIDHTVQRLLDGLRHKHEQISEMGLVVRRMIAVRGVCYAASTYPIWTEPLPTLLPLLNLLDHVSPSWLQAPIGLIDRPEDAQQIPLFCDLAGMGGNILALGASGSGKTTLLQTVVLALAYHHSPVDLWVYLIDSNGSGLGLRGKLPHIADCLAPRQHVQVERLLAELQEQLESRRHLFQQHSVTSLSQYRERTTRMPTLPPSPPALLVVIDNIAELNSQHETMMETLKVFMREARAYGIYVLASAYAMRDVSSIAANFETRLALRLNSDDDSVILVGKDYASKLIRADQPGRGFMRGSPRPIEIHIALPALRKHVPISPAESQPGDTNVAYSDTSSELEYATKHIAARWQDAYEQFPERSPQPLRLLSTVADMGVLLNDVASAGTRAYVVPLGIEGSTLKPLLWSLEKTAHLLIAGGLRSGKGTLLRALLAACADRYTPEEVEVILVDYGMRTLRNHAQAAHVRLFTELKIGAELRDVNIISDKEEFAAVLQALNAELAERSKALRQGRSLTRRTLLAIYNWDLMSPIDGQLLPALTALEQYARRGSDLGLHVIVTNTDFNSGSMGLIKSLRANCAEIVMGRPLENSAYAQTIGKRFKAVLASEMPSGRGFILESGQPPRVVQFAGADVALLTRVTAQTNHTGISTEPETTLTSF